MGNEIIKNLGISFKKAMPRPLPNNEEHLGNLTYHQNARRSLGLPFKGEQPAALYIAPKGSEDGIYAESSAPISREDADAVIAVVHEYYRENNNDICQLAPRGLNVIYEPKIDKEGNADGPAISFPTDPNPQTIKPQSNGSGKTKTIRDTRSKKLSAPSKNL